MTIGSTECTALVAFSQKFAPARLSYNETQIDMHYFQCPPYSACAVPTDCQAPRHQSNRRGPGLKLSRWGLTNRYNTLLGALHSRTNLKPAFFLGAHSHN